MYLIAGLGNPELRFRGTRHNIGFDMLDVLCDKLGNLKLNDTKFNGAYTLTNWQGERLLLVKPLTYMNLSGQCLAPLAAYYKIPPEQVIVCYDDIALEPGRLRVRPGGSAGGHNGLKSIIASLGTENFPRVRIGVGARPEYMDLADYVLSRFSAQERPTVDSACEEAAEAVLKIISEGVEAAMNSYNARK